MDYPSTNPGGLHIPRTHPLASSSIANVTDPINMFIALVRIPRRRKAILLLLHNRFTSLSTMMPCWTGLLLMSLAVLLISLSPHHPSIMIHLLPFPLKPQHSWKDPLTARLAWSVTFLPFSPSL